MGADQPILLKPHCPAPDDPEILEFLRLAGAVCSTGSIELTIDTEASGESRSYTSGTRHGKRTSIILEVGGGYSASMKTGLEKPPGPETVEILSSNLKRTLESKQFREQAAVLRGALDGTPCSVLLFDELGNIVFANPPADRLLSLQTEDELLAECGNEARQPLFNLLASLIEQVVSSREDKPTFSGTLTLADGRNLICEISPIQGADDSRSGVILVFLQPAESESDVRYDSFSSRHRLSPREHDVVMLLVQGLTTTAMADQLGISPHTVRDHLKHLYRKTETRSRSELLGLLSRSRRSTDGAATRQ